MSRGLVLALAAALGCEGAGDGPHALFDLHQPNQALTTPSATRDFYALPFPNDLRLRADGTIDLTSYPRSVGTVAQYLDVIDHDPAGGFSTQGAIFFRLDGAVDPGSLPGDATGSLADDSSLYLVDVTPGSPTYDRRTPVTTRFEPTAYDFIGPNWLALLPVPGLPLRERTSYAAILTDGVRGEGGGRLRRSPDFDLVAAGTADGAANSAYAPLRAWLIRHPAAARHVVDAALFTTRDATALMPRLRAAVYDQAPAPTLDGLVDAGEDAPGVDHLYVGSYVGPNFQVGDPPYDDGGGNIVRGDGGVPQLQKLETLRIAISVPDAPMPAAGWPVILYQHGTGGDYKSFVRDGSARTAARVTDATGAVVARFAMIGTDGVGNGTRVPPGGNHDIDFFNLLNLAAAHDNPHQGAADGFQLVRLVHGVDLAAAPGTGAPIRFDTAHIYFKGHSQGSLTGPLFLAAEPEISTAVLSGAGAGLITSLLAKTEPRDIRQLVQIFFHDPVDAFHPVLSLVQGYVDDADPANYGRRLCAEPLPGMSPKSIFQSLGVVDHYTPVPNIQALALAMGAAPVGPQLVLPSPFTAGALASPPVQGNVAGGAATAVLLEYAAAPGRDGHFVIFDVPAAVSQSNRFLASALSGLPRLDPP